MLCEQELVDKLQSIQTWIPSLNYYGDPIGERTFRQELCHFFQDALHLDNDVQLTPDRMIITGGAAGAFIVYSYMLTDVNDAILVPSPYYSYIDHNVSILTENQIIRCPLLNQSTGKFRLSREIFEHGYIEAQSKGLNPRAIILINPSNPLGDIYDEMTIRPIFQFAAEKRMHVIVDEIYALSTFVTECFQSILNYNSSLPDPDRTHFLWSFSKDFSLSGARVGIIYAGTAELCTKASKINFVLVPSRNIQYTFEQLIANREWIHAYIALNRQRLTHRYIQVKSTLETIEGVKIRQSHAGFFIWADLRELLPDKASFNDEKRLFEHLFNCAGVFVLRGHTLGCTEPGWFRFIFSVNDTIMTEALMRIEKALTQTYCSHFSI
ncbi:unnamed protein product [Rotaria sordida]|uniref:Aminotransferase class I/classII large domain-containing protein n=1 Tax=Rotaria sordida TaxID=392033 RepID=A0A815GHA3_9BILA|nr:unnamed protein product [Rotaria sordida]CAF1596197.1 unnamed protein product [Rotaria sordida]